MHTYQQGHYKAGQFGVNNSSPNLGANDSYKDTLDTKCSVHEKKNFFWIKSKIPETKNP